MPILGIILTTTIIYSYLCNSVTKCILKYNSKCIMVLVLKWWYWWKNYHKHSKGWSDFASILIDEIAPHRKLHNFYILLLWLVTTKNLPVCDVYLTTHGDIYVSFKEYCIFCFWPNLKYPVIGIIIILWWLFLCHNNCVI